PSRYLSRLRNDVYAALKAVIQSELGDLAALDPDEREIGAHQNLSRQLLSGPLPSPPGERPSGGDAFVGRRALMEDIRAYLSGPGEVPLLLFGRGGVGKSTVMARAAREAAAARPGALVVTRFVGASPG